MKSLSYVIPTFNNLFLLKRCLKILEPQIDEIDRIIIIDDGSTDGTYEYLTEKYTGNSNYIIKKQKNAGSGKARNYGMELANTDYIWFIDSDDYIENESIKIIKERLEENGVDMLYFDYVEKSEKGNNVISLNINTRKKNEIFLTQHFPWNKIIKKSITKNIYFPEEKIRYQDHGTIPIMISRAKEIEYIKQPLYYYDFSHNNNISKQYKKNDDMYIAFSNLVNYYELKMLKENELEILFINTFIFSQLYNTPFKNFKDVYSNSEKVKKYLNNNYPNWKKSDLLKLTTKKQLGNGFKNGGLKLLIGKIFKYNTFFTSIFIFLFKKAKYRKM